MKYSLLSTFWMLQLIVVQQLAGQNIQLTFSVAPPACAGYTDGIATVTATGGTGPYAYHWNNNQAGQSNFGVGAGVSSVTVTDQNGLTATGSVTITQPTQIVAAINPNGVHCLTGGGTLIGSATGGTPPYTYVWGNGSTSATIPITNGGAYLLTVTDSKGCSDLENYFVNPPLAVEIEVQNIPCFMFCDGVAWANVTGGTPPYTYLWSNGGTSSQIVELTPGWYGVMVTDATGCSIIDSAFVYEPPEITIAFNTIIPACGGSNGSVTAQAGGGTPPYTYLWNYNNVTGPTLSNVPTGSYYLQITDANGCQKSMPVSIPVGTGLNVSLNTQNAGCQGVNDGSLTAIVSPSGGNYSYQWSVQNATTATLNGLAAGTSACVTVTDVNSGCKGTVCGVIGTSGSNISLQVTDTDVSCATDLTGTATASASSGTGPYTYVWTYPNNTTTTGPTISGLGAGAYSVQATDNRGCTATASANVGVVSTLNAAYEISVVECEGDSLHVRFTDKSADPNSTIVAWNWNIVWGSGSIQSNQQNPLVNLPANETGTAQLTVTSAGGCTALTSAPFSVNALPNVHINVNSPAFNCDGSPVHINVTGDPSYTYTWFPMAGLTFDPGPQNVIANPAQTQIYTLVAGNGSCADTVQVEVIRQTPLALSVGAHEVFACTSTATLTATVNVTATIKWFNAGGASVGTGTSITVPASAVPTEYHIVATDALGCTQTDSITVTGKEVSIALNVPAELFNCSNAPDTINVVGAPANTYTWSPMTGLTFPDPNSPNVIADPEVTTNYQVVATNGFCSDTARVKVIRVTPIELAVENATVVSCDENATLEATINAASNAEVRWQPTNETDMSITVPATSTPTTYTVIATDPVYGCTQSATATVVGRAAEVELVATTPTSACENQSIELNINNQHPTDTLSYQWSSNPNLQITTVDNSNVTVSGAAGSYVVTVEVTNQYGCKDQQEIPVTFLEAGTMVGAVNVRNCGNLTVDFQVPGTVSGTWNFGDNQTSPANNVSHVYTAPGTYNVTFTPAGAADCIQPFDTVVQVQMASVVPADITANLVSCAAQAVYDLVAQPGTGNYTWQWTAGGQTSTGPNPTFTFNQAGPVPVQLTVTDAQGCVGTDTLSLNVNLINEEIAATMTVCPGNSVQLNPEFDPTYTYLWTASPGDPTLVTNSPNPTVTPTAATTYTLQVSNGNCSVEYTAQVTPQPTVALDAGPNQKVCDDTPVTLSVQNPVAGANYQWSESETFNTILAEGSSVQVTPQQNGVYYVRAETAGCTSLGSVRVDNAKLRVDALPKDPNICLGQSTPLNITNLNPNDTLTYIWTSGLDSIANQTVTPTTTTTYSAVVSNQFGCLDTVAFKVSVTELAVTAEVVGKDTICPGQFATLLATATGTGTVFTYSWTPTASLNDPNIASPTARPDVETEYTVTATADGRCPNTASVTIYFMGDQCIEPYIFVPKAFSPNGDQSNDHFIVRGVNIKELYMVIWDRWGEKVYETEDTQALGWDGTYKGASLTPDAYAWYVKATCGNGAVYEKKGNVTLLK